MAENINRPREYDAILGGQELPITGSLILGGLDKIKHILANASIEQRIQHLPAVLQYDRAGLDFLAQVFKQDESWQVQRTAYWLLQAKAQLYFKQVLQTDNPYQQFQRLRTIDISDTSSPYTVDFVNALLVSPNGKTLISSSSKNIQTWQLDTGLQLRTFPDYGSIAVTPDGQTLVSGSGSYDGTISLWNLETGTLERNILGDTKGAGIDAIAISPNGETLASASNYQGKVKVWQLHSGKLLYTCAGHKPLVMNPNGQNFVSGSKDGSIKVWSLYSGTLLRTIPGQGKEVTAIAISPNGQTLASGSWDGTVYLWHLLTGNLLNTLSHSQTDTPITAIAISPDGNALASSGRRGTVKLWNLHTGETLRDLTGYPDWISSIAFSPDGATIAIGGWKGKIDVWSCEPTLDQSSP